jgi:hypothetical protein
MEGLRQSEVQHLDLAVGRDVDVGGLQVPMHDTLLMRGFQRFGDLGAAAQRFSDLQRSGSQPAREGFAGNQLQHQVADTAGFLQTMNGADVGMIQRRQHAGFVFESGQPLWIFTKGFRQDLNRHLTA